MAQWSQFLFQDAASPVMIQLVSLHDHTLSILTMVLTLVVCMLYSITSNSFTLLDAQEIETIWTVVPTMILVVLALHSLRLLYLMDK